jgi:hypothetical protein
VASLCRAGLDTRRDAQKVSEITISYVISSPLSRLGLAQHHPTRPGRSNPHMSQFVGHSHQFRAEGRQQIIDYALDFEMSRFDGWTYPY